MTLRVASLFAGAGGLDEAFRLAVPDSETVWFSEIDPSACAVLARAYPDVPNLGDVTEIDWAELARGGDADGSLGDVDVILAGFP